jgi:hypothetical protein
MNESNNKLKKMPDKPPVIRDYEDILNNNKLNLLPTTNHNAHLKSLTNPQFLGSYHLKEAINSRYKSINTLLKGDLDVKYAKALRSNILNPVTISLIIIALIFNVMWFFFV